MLARVARAVLIPLAIIGGVVNLILWLFIFVTWLQLDASPTAVSVFTWFGGALLGLYIAGVVAALSVVTVEAGGDLLRWVRYGTVDKCEARDLKRHYEERKRAAGSLFTADASVDAGALSTAPRAGRGALSK